MLLGLHALPVMEASKLGLPEVHSHPMGTSRAVGIWPLGSDGWAVSTPCPWRGHMLPSPPMRVGGLEGKAACSLPPHGELKCK